MIYIFRSGKFIKIGYSKTVGSVYRRLATTQTHNPNEVTLIKILKGDITAEHKLHYILDAYRVRGEWFVYDDIVLSMIAQLDAT